MASGPLPIIKDEMRSVGGHGQMNVCLEDFFGHPLFSEASFGNQKLMKNPRKSLKIVGKSYNSLQNTLRIDC